MNFSVWLQALNFCFQNDSKNWTFFRYDPKKLNFFAYDSKELNFFIWFKELNFFSISTQRIEFFCDMTQTIEPLFQTQRIEIFQYDMQNWTFLKNTTHRIEHFFFLTTTHRNGLISWIWRKDLSTLFFEYDAMNWTVWFLKMTHRIELFFFNFDSQNWSLLKYDSKILFFKNDFKKIDFFEYDSKNWIFF